MSWSEYVKRHTKGRTQTDLATTVGVSQAAVSRWLRGTQGVDADMAVRFARAVGDSPLLALTAAGFLTEAEAKVQPMAAPDFSQLSNDELLELVRSRMREEGGGAHAGSAAPIDPPGSGPHLAAVASGDEANPDEAAEADRLAAEAKARQQEAIEEMERKKREREKGDDR